MATIMSGVATAVRRGWSSARATRGVTAAALAAAGRPDAAVPSVAGSRSATWGRAKDGRGYASNGFQHKNRLALKAVAEPASDAEVVEEPIKLLTSDESEELLKIRHTTAHICAMATQKLFPNAQCTIGPW